MKLFDPAVVEARRVVADPATGLGELRAIEVAVLHPTSDSQLAFAHLLPPPTDVDAGRRSRRSGRGPTTCVRRAIGTGRRRRSAALREHPARQHRPRAVRHPGRSPATRSPIDAVESGRIGAWPAVGRRSIGRLAGDGPCLDPLALPARLPRLPRGRPGPSTSAASVELEFPAPYLLHGRPILHVSRPAGDETRRRMRLRLDRGGVRGASFSPSATWSSTARPPRPGSPRAGPTSSPASGRSPASPRSAASRSAARPRRAVDA